MTNVAYIGQCADMSRFCGMKEAAAAWYERHAKAILAILIAAAILAVPELAFADQITDGIANVFTSITDVLLSPFRDAMIDHIAGNVGTLAGLTDIVLAPAKHTIPVTENGRLSNFTDAAAVLNSAGDLPMKEVLAYIIGVYDVIKPVCYTILAIVFGIQTIKILQQPDNPVGGVPYIEKFGWMWIKFALLKLLMDDSMDISVAIFNLFAKMGQDIATSSNSFLGALDAQTVTDTVKTTLQSSFGNTELAGMMVNTIFLLIADIALWIVLVLVYISVYGRWLQVFIYLPFAPLFFSFLGEDETKQMFWSYIRSIAGAGLAMIITIILVKAVPAIMMACITTDRTLAGVGVIGSVVLVGWSCMHAGQWAHDMIGG